MIKKSRSYCYKRVCEHCKKEFWSNKKSGRFCSKDCRWDFERLHNLNTLPVCPVCGKKVKRHKAKYCSPSCAAESRRLPVLHCSHCGDAITEWRDRSHKSHYCSRSCANEGQKVDETLTSGGYRLVLPVGDFPGTRHGKRKRHVLEHVLVWWLNTGVIPSKGEVVHHINQDKLDNRFDNLQLMTASDHMKLHASLKAMKAA